MHPTIKESDLIFIDPLPGDLDRFDIVIFENAEFSESMGVDADTRYVARIIGLPGEQVNLVDDLLFIDGKHVKQEFQFVGCDERPRCTNLDVTLEDDEFALLGDNRPNSVDSRHWSKPGIKRSKLISKVGRIVRN